MATRLRAIKVDQENGAEQKSKKVVQLTKTTTTGLTKRAALGELGNRAHGKATEIQKESILKNVKPRVESYRRKADAAPSAASKGGVVKTQKAPTIAVRTSNEVKVIKPRGAVKSKADEKQVTQQLPSFQDVILPVRREESNVSRRSLSKLKAVLCKEKKDKPKAIVVPTVCATAATNKAVQLKQQNLQKKTVAHSSALLDEACVENIDAGDSKNPLLVSEYANDIYSYLFQMELDMPIRKGHLEKQAEVTPKMRAVLLDWINEVSFQFRLLPETYHLTVAIIDRYLQEVHITQRHYLQLVGIGALFIASKYEELYPPEIGDFVYIADDSYSKQQILNIEQRIIRSIDFNLGRPSSIHFLRRFSKAASTVEENHMLAKYLIEIASIDYNLAHNRPSEIAAASLLLSLKLLATDNTLTDDQLWTNTLKFYTSYTVENLKPVVKQIAVLLKHAPTAQLKAVYSKYQSSKFDKIALKPELSGPRLDQIISE